MGLGKKKKEDDGCVISSSFFLTDVVCSVSSLAQVQKSFPFLNFKFVACTTIATHTM